MMTCEEMEPEKTQKRSQTETKERRKERKLTKLKTTRRRKGEQKGVKRDQNGSKRRPQHIKRHQRMGEVRKVVKRMSTSSAESSLIREKRRFSRLTVLTPGARPGGEGGPTRQRGGVGGTAQAACPGGTRRGTAPGAAPASQPGDLPIKGGGFHSRTGRIGRSRAGRPGIVPIEWGDP